MIFKAIILMLSLTGWCAGNLFAQTFYEDPQMMKGATPLPGMRGAVANLPDISIIGVMKGYASDDKTDTDKDKFEFEEVEAAFQGYIYPEMRADVFLAIHNHDGTYEAEICEAKATFQRMLEGLSAEAGKIHVNFGRLNKIHGHHRLMADQPQAITNFFGDHGLVGQGGTLSYLFPLPFYMQLEGGAWSMEGHHHHPSETAEVLDTSLNPVNAFIETESEEFSLADKAYTGRLRTSFAPTKKTEFELGSSVAKGKGAHFSHHKDNAIVFGADLTLRAWPTAYRRWIFQNEWFYLKREVPVGKLYRNGAYSYLNYRFTKYWDAGVRWDYAEGAFPVNEIERAVSGIVHYHLTETSMLGVQYKKRYLENNKEVNEAWLRLAFGIGPHSHELE
ncbi:MAG: hypothetical protein HY747_09875 [Elusimicrobia bacterium]|nr:hypothetical protein [Elusimicrobiota bacterium]